LKYKKLITGVLLGAMMLPMCAEAEFQRAADSWNQFNIAYKSLNYKWMEELVRMDETDIVDETVKTEINIDEDNVIRPVENKRMFGYGYETPFMSVKNFFEDNTLELADGYLDMTERFYDAPVVRFGGAASNYNDYLSLIGSLSNRKRIGTVPYISEYNANYKPGTYSIFQTGNEIGPIESIKLAQAVNKDTEYIICLPWEVLEPKELVNVCRFFVDEADQSEFGALRASLGIKEPVNVLGFEMGNELYITESGYTNKRTADRYIKDVKSFMNIMHSYRDDLNFSVPLRLSKERDPETWLCWSDWLAEGIGEYLTYGSPHIYYGGYEYAFWKDWIPSVYGSFTKYLGEDTNLKFMITEHGKWYGRNDDKCFDTHTLYSTLTVSEFFTHMYKLPYVDAATYYCYANSMWAMVKRISDDWVVMGMPKLFDVWMQNIGDSVVDMSIKSDSIYTDENVYAMKFTGTAMKNGDDELVLFLNNRKPYVEFDIDFNFQNEYTLVEETIFTAPNIYSFAANKNTEDIFTTTVNKKNIENFNSYTMPSKSLVVLRLKKNS